MTEYIERFYRDWIDTVDLNKFEVRDRETDLLILSDINLEHEARFFVSRIRKELEDYIEENLEFKKSLTPVDVRDDAPLVVRKMSEAAKIYDVGPMASVAGAVSELVGRALLEFSNSAIVENGGDIFAKVGRKIKFSLFAGNESPFTNKLMFVVDASNGVGICTSSGKVGHSLSFGNADAVVVVAKNVALADAAATSMANRIQTSEDIYELVEIEAQKGLVQGIIACAGDKIALWGDIALYKEEIQ
jgi:ApbE superfamily uncharacterized protein (UPF0280 family)